MSIPAAATTVLGHSISMPVLVSPVGGLRLAHRDGELGAARAAGAMGIPIGISTIHSPAGVVCASRFTTSTISATE